MIVESERCSFEFMYVQTCSVQSFTKEKLMGKGPQKWKKKLKKKAKKRKPRISLGQIKKGLRKTK